MDFKDLKVMELGIFRSWNLFVAKKVQECLNLSWGDWFALPNHEKDFYTEDLKRFYRFEVLVDVSVFVSEIEGAFD